MENPSATCLGALGNAETTLTDVDARLGLLELMYRTQVNGNLFTMSFSDMSGLVVTGVWTVFFIISKRGLHGNMVLRFFRPVELFLLYCHEHLIQNNGLMGVGVEISLHETIIFYLSRASADCFLE